MGALYTVQESSPLNKQFNSEDGILKIDNILTGLMEHFPKTKVLGALTWLSISGL